MFSRPGITRNGAPACPEGQGRQGRLFFHTYASLIDIVGQALEKAVYIAASQLAQASRARHAHIETLKSQAEILCASLQALKTEEDPEEQLPYDRFHYYLSEETHRAELLDDLGRLKEMWENVRKEGDERRRTVGKKDVKKGWWFW